MYKKLPLSDGVIVLVLMGILCVQVFFLLFRINTALLYETTIRYGDINEGIVGVPNYKNPLYAVTSAEKDVASLLHAGLLIYDAVDGSFIPHLAETYSEESPNRYIFTLRKNAAFHDGSVITTDDVLHTVNMIQQEQKYRSIYYEAWEDVVVEAIDDVTLVITVPEGNLHFPEYFTTPVLPHHIWKKISADRQRDYHGSGVYVGAGPYVYSRETVTLDGRPTTLTFEEFSGHVLGRPFIQTISFHFFVDVADLLEAYELGVVDSVHGVTAAEAKTLLKQREGDAHGLRVADTNRVFGAFFNAADGRLSAG